MKVDEDHDEAAEDDGGRAEVVAGPAAVAGIDVAWKQEKKSFLKRTLIPLFPLLLLLFLLSI